jgi:hypothetical protein
MDIGTETSRTCEGVTVGGKDTRNMDTALLHFKPAKKTVQRAIHSAR